MRFSNLTLSYIRPLSRVIRSVNSNKSEKNMADFEGEEALSDDELAHINAQAHYSPHTHMQQHLANMASFYQKPRPTKGMFFT